MSCHDIGGGATERVWPKWSDSYQWQFKEKKICAWNRFISIAVKRGKDSCLKLVRTPRSQRFVTTTVPLLNSKLKSLLCAVPPQAHSVHNSQCSTNQCVWLYGLDKVQLWCYPSQKIWLCLLSSICTTEKTQENIDKEAEVIIMSWYFAGSAPMLKAPGVL